MIFCLGLSGLELDDGEGTIDDIFESDSRSKVTLAVVTKVEQPYVMLDESKKGNERYYGFAIDLLKVTSPKKYIVYKTRKSSFKCFKMICNSILSEEAGEVQILIISGHQ